MGWIFLNKIHETPTKNYIQNMGTLINTNNQTNMSYIRLYNFLLTYELKIKDDLFPF